MRSTGQGRRRDASRISSPTPRVNAARASARPLPFKDTMRRHARRRRRAGCARWSRRWRPRKASATAASRNITHMTSPGLAALANGVAAHALDYDDMCFVSLAHPSCALVPAVLAAGELVHAPAGVLLDAYVVGFELECRLGNVMNPRHYHERGWHCTRRSARWAPPRPRRGCSASTRTPSQHALGIAASSACGLKENIGSMVKPLHAGMAARNGVMAARLAQRGFTASPHAIDGPQGYLAAMDSEQRVARFAVADLGVRWEILETGVTVKLYPSCAATHPPLDALIDMKRREGSPPTQVQAIDVEVDSMTPRLLIHPNPATGLEAKFSMPFCAAAAVVFGRARHRHVRRRAYPGPGGAEPDAASHAPRQRGVRPGGAAVAGACHRAAARRPRVVAVRRRRARVSGPTDRRGARDEVRRLRQPHVDASLPPTRRGPR